MGGTYETIKFVARGVLELKEQNQVFEGVNRLYYVRM